MNTTKRVLIGAAVLALFACVLVTGCAAAADNSADAKAVTGSWIVKTENSLGILNLQEDGNGLLALLADEYGDSRLNGGEPFTWKIDADGKLILDFSSLNIVISLTYDKASACFVDQDGLKYTRLDPITGIWFGESVSFDNGKAQKANYIFKNDGTGMVTQSYKNGGTEVYAFAWKKSGNKYNLSYVNGFAEELTLNDLQDGFVSSMKKSTDGYKKMFVDKFLAPQIIGAWVDEKTSALTVFGADGGGVRIVRGDASPLQWKMIDYRNYFVEFTDGKLKGYAGRYTYDLKTNTLTTTTGVVLSRPAGDFDGLKIRALPKSMTVADKLVGTWVTEDVVNGIRQYIVPVFKSDGTGTSFVISKNDNNRIVESDPITWEMSGDKTFTVYMDGYNPFYTKYNPATDTLITNLGLTLKRINPATDTWYAKVAANIKA